MYARLNDIDLRGINLSDLGFAYYGMEKFKEDAYSEYHDVSSDVRMQMKFKAKHHLNYASDRLNRYLRQIEQIPSDQSFVKYPIRNQALALREQLDEFFPLLGTFDQKTGSGAYVNSEGYLKTIVEDLNQADEAIGKLYLDYQPVFDSLPKINVDAKAAAAAAMGSMTEDQLTEIANKAGSDTEYYNKLYQSLYMEKLIEQYEKKLGPGALSGMKELAAQNAEFIKANQPILSKVQESVQGVIDKAKNLPSLIPSAGDFISSLLKWGAIISVIGLVGVGSLFYFAGKGIVQKRRAKRRA